MTIWPDMPDCGVYLVWPQDGTDWIHPDDVAQVSDWIPSNRVWRRSKFEEGFYRLHYGDHSIRVKPTMWHRVEDQGYSVGDRVEILGRFLENEPCVGRIVEMRFDKRSGRIHYHIATRDLILPRPFLAEDLRALDQKVNLRTSDFDTTIVPSEGQSEIT